MTEKKKSLKKKIVTGAVTSATFLGLITGGVFGTPKEIVEINDLDEQLIQSGEEHSIKTTLAMLVKKLVYTMPLALRLFLILPLWYLGSLLIFTATKAAETVLPPVLALLSKYLIIILVLFALIILAVKLINPNLKIKEILTKRTIITYVSTITFLILCDSITPLWMNTYDRIEFIVHSVSYLIMLIIILVPFIRKEIISKRCGLRSKEAIEELIKE